MAFLDQEFLLGTSHASSLYRNHAAPQPILDYHCHLSPHDIADDRQFESLYEIWLEGDHYKWRAMRANGVPERLVTGDADPYEKFAAWAATVPRCLRNPLYHWSHLELQRYFGITELLNEASGRRIWDRAAEGLRSGGLTARGILSGFRVTAVCTTDDPADDLSAHERIRASGCSTRVYPTFRPDRALDVRHPDRFNTWADRLSASANVDTGRLSGFIDALAARHQAFHDMGARLSDHGLRHCHTAFCSDAIAAGIFDRVRAGQPATPEEVEQFASYLMLYFGHLDAAKGWTKQLHLGPQRNVSTRAFLSGGADLGYDCIGDWPQAGALAAYLDRLDREGALPKTIVYNVNPADNYTVATTVGSFQDGGVPGKMQFGSGWWFLDQKDGIEWQLDTLSRVGLLARFVGMTTDSRSFMSYPRHEYFRRVLCNQLGREMANGELPDDEALVGSLVQDVCFRNAHRYFGLG